MYINYLAVAVASIVQFIIAAIWYTPIFGKTWGRIHGFDKVSKEEQQKMMRGMGPLLALQFLATVVTTLVFALFYAALPQGWNAYGMAGFFWIGFIVPTQASAVIFGGTPKQWMWTKFGIMLSGSFLCMEAAAAVLHFMK